jgi:DNA polymerase-3 subunit delta
VPETTELVFVDGPLSRGNRMLAAVRPHAQVRSFSLPDEAGIGRWVRDRAESQGIQIEPAAAKALDKLAVYRGGQTIRREDVDELVSYAREANIFQAVDAMVEGRLDAAVTMVHQLLRLGRTPGYILAMVARQVRLLILAKELKARRVPPAEHGKRLGLSGYPLRKTMEQERAFSGRRLEQIHRKLLEADVQIKTTGADEGMVLDVLIAEVAVDGRR